jgi:hypothetical protein
LASAPETSSASFALKTIVYGMFIIPASARHVRRLGRQWAQVF